MLCSFLLPLFRLAQLVLIDDSTEAAVHLKLQLSFRTDVDWIEMDRKKSRIARSSLIAEQMNFHVHLITRDGLRDNTFRELDNNSNLKSRLTAAMSKLRLSSKRSTAMCGELSSALTKQRGKKTL